MAVVVIPYSSDHFHSLPYLENARDRFHNLQGANLVENVFKEFFLDEGMDRTFGLALMHRHFNLPTNHMLVEYNGTSTPWDAGASEGMEQPQPLIWSFNSKGELTPTEFKYSKGHNTVLGKKELAFVKGFRHLLEEKGLMEVFGLCQYPGDDFDGTCEITKDKANINLQPADVSQSSPVLIPSPNLSPP